MHDVLLLPTTMAEGDPNEDLWAADEAPVDLGRGLSLKMLDHHENELILDACTARGHFFVAVRQFGVRYALELELDTDVYDGPESYGWDTDGVMLTAMQLSRLVCDNGYSSQFAARIVDHDDGEQQVIPQGQHYLDFLPVYRLRNDRDWLTEDEAHALRDLLDAYLTRRGDRLTASTAPSRSARASSTTA